MEVEPLDIVETLSPCRHCGENAWIVDTDGHGRYWLLCLDQASKGCVECIDLPENMTIKPRE